MVQRTTDADNVSFQSLQGECDSLGLTAAEFRIAYRQSVNRNGSISRSRGLLVAGRLIAARDIDPDSYRASPTRKKRRSQKDIEHLKAMMFAVVMKQQPMTVRQVFYRLTTMGVIEKTQNEYDNVVCRLLSDMRKDRELPFDWIADNTRWMRRPECHSSLGDMLRETQKFYRRDIWDNQNCYVEVWLEKEALAGVMVDVTAEWHVPLMVTRGYPSLSFLHGAAENIRDDHREIYIYYFGDYDPSGMDISRNVHESLVKYSGRDDIHFERVAVNYDQIEEWDLPTRPTKKSDSRSKNFKGESVEVDAIPPSQLRELCRECIVQHIDGDRLEAIQTAEEAERETLNQIANIYG